jgi:hypothetical protein
VFENKVLTKTFKPVGNDKGRTRIQSKDKLRNSHRSPNARAENPRGLSQVAGYVAMIGRQSMNIYMQTFPNPKRMQ